MSEYRTREDGLPYESEIVANDRCAYCGANISVRAEGRPRKFCDSTCRSGAYRSSTPSNRVRIGLKRTKRA